MDRDPMDLVVIAPDTLAKGFLRHDCAQVVKLWGKGRVKIAMTSDLLKTYLKLLKRLGIAEPQLRIWARWFTAEDKTVMHPLPAEPNADWAEITLNCATASGARAIISLDMTGHDNLFTPKQFLADYA